MSNKRRESPRDLRQQRAFKFVADTFGADAGKPTERAMRFFEEACELAQAAGLTPQQCVEIGQHVLHKPMGDPRKEIGDVGLCLLAYAESIGASADEEEAREIDRVLAIDRDYFRERHKQKFEAGISVAQAPWGKS